MNKNRLFLCVYCLFMIGCFAPHLITKEKRGIFVSIFKNNTKEYDLSPYLNLVLTDEIMKERNFTITNKENSDLDLKGSIIDFKKTPIAWDKEMKITESKMSIAIEFEVFNKGSLLFNEHIFCEIIYSHKEREEKEKERLLKRASRLIVNRLKKHDL